jgi:hypothetical protein
MARPILYEVLLFLVPFALYALWLATRNMNPARKESWRGAPLLWLLLGALVSTGIGLGLVGHFGGAPAGSTYVPAHMEDGKLVGPEMK